MKLCFSTIGCPDWNWSEIITTAKDIGMDGIEIRGMGNELYAPACRPFTEEKIEKTKQKLADTNMEIPIFTSGAVVGVAEKAEIAKKEAFGYIDLAEKMGTKYVRIMPTDRPYPEKTDLDLCAAVYGEICDYAAPKGVTPIIETNGVLAESAVMAEFIAKVNRKNSGVLWDVHHPYRYFNETPEQTAENLKGLIKHIHVKDSICENGVIKYKMLGKGDVPVATVLDILKAQNYDGYISLEWVKRWNPDLEAPGIVFAQFASYMKYTANIK